MLLNTSRAKFSEGTKIYVYSLCFFLYTDMTQVVEILPQVWQELFYIFNIMGADVLPWHQQPWYLLRLTELIKFPRPSR